MPSAYAHALLGLVPKDMDLLAAVLSRYFSRNSGPFHSGLAYSYVITFGNQQHIIQHYGVADVADQLLHYQYVAGSQ